MTPSEIIARLRAVGRGKLTHIGVNPELLHEAADALASMERDRDEWKERAGFLWTAPDVDAWGRVAEAKGLPLRDKINGLLRRSVRAEEAALAAERSLADARGMITLIADGKARFPEDFARAFLSSEQGGK